MYRCVCVCVCVCVYIYIYIYTYKKIYIYQWLGCQGIRTFFFTLGEQTIQQGSQTSTAHSATPNLKEKGSPRGELWGRVIPFWLARKGFPLSVLFGQAPGCIRHPVLTLNTAPPAYFALHFRVKNPRFPNYLPCPIHPHPVSLHPDLG